MADRVIFHVDANSAFLSWSAAYRLLVLGEREDLRQIPAVVAGERFSRHGIVLAKSIPTKKYGIRTGEPLYQALEKCPTLRVVEPDFGLYTACSRQMIALLREVAPAVEQFSIDEAWADMTGTERLYGPPICAAEMLRERIFRELGFTVNIGVSSNKLLAKMAGDFEKPNRVHSLFPREIPEKLWPLPVEALFLVGAATAGRLRRMGIGTIGALAGTPVEQLRRVLGKQGELLWNFANGHDAEPVREVAAENKGYGNSVTLARNVTDTGTAHRVLLGLCETVGTRLRRDGKTAGCLAVTLRDGDFHTFSHRRQLPGTTDVTGELYGAACAAFDEAWDGKTPLRLLGVQASKLAGERYCQLDLFSREDPDRQERRARLDRTVDSLRCRFGENSVRRARLVSDAGGQGGQSRARKNGAAGEPARTFYNLPYGHISEI